MHVCEADQLVSAACNVHPEEVSGSDNPLVIAAYSTSPFLSSRPEWTVNGALLNVPDGRAARVTQSPFLWVDGAWEALVTILPIEASEGLQTQEVQVRVTPDTLRRWNEVGINPFLEACAQLRDYWCAYSTPARPQLLTWL